jgi:hypothetical protein
MTKMTYDVINRPKNDQSGRTNVGWAAERGKEAVTVGGYLTTSRAAKGQSRIYTATMIKGGIETVVGNTFTTRAQAAFAIWRAYNVDFRDERAINRARVEAEAENRRRDRAIRKAYRQTPEGLEAYRAELNEKARIRRESLTDEQKAALVAKRKAKRLQKA